MNNNYPKFTDIMKICMDNNAIQHDDGEHFLIHYLEKSCSALTVITLTSRIPFLNDISDQINQLLFVEVKLQGLVTAKPKNVYLMAAGDCCDVAREGDYINLNIRILSDTENGVAPFVSVLPLIDEQEVTGHSLKFYLSKEQAEIINKAINNQ